MSRVLFINGPEEEHVRPTLGLTAELVRRGETVTYVTIEPFRSLVESTGAEFRPCPDVLEGLRPDGPLSFLGLAEMLLKSAHAAIPAVIDQTRGEKFDYLIHDSLYGCGAMVAQILKLPSAAAFIGFAPTRAWPKQPGKGRRGSARLALQGAKSIPGIMRNAREIAAAYGIPQPRIPDAVFNRGGLNLVFTSRYFQPEANVLDYSFSFVGPSVVDYPTSFTGRFPLERFAGRHVLFIAVSGAFREEEQALQFYRLCFKAFGALPLAVVLSVGERDGIIERLERAPRNFIVREQVPQLDILQNADVFLTDGGLSGTNEALYYGVPLAVLEQSPGQSREPSAAAWRAVEMGAGIRLPANKTTAAALRDAVSGLLADDQYRRRAKTIGESFRASGGAERAADEVEAFKEKQGLR